MPDENKNFTSGFVPAEDGLVLRKIKNVSDTGVLGGVSRYNFEKILLNSIILI